MIKIKCQYAAYEGTITHSRRDPVILVWLFSNILQQTKRTNKKPVKIRVECVDPC